MYLCLSALAESSSGRCGTFVCYCWMMFRVDGCLNEDPGPLPGPRNCNFIDLVPLFNVRFCLPGPMVVAACSVNGDLTVVEAQVLTVSTFKMIIDYELK